MITYSYFGFRQEISRYEHEGEVRPYWWLYGKAWRDFNRDSQVKIIIPFNLIVTFLRYIWHGLLWRFWAKYIISSKIEKLQNDAYYSGKNSVNAEGAFNNGVRLGKKEGYEEGYIRGEAEAINYNYNMFLKVRQSLTKKE